MGWCEPRGPSAEMVARAEERRAADHLAAVVAEFLSNATTGNRERMELALERYRDEWFARARG